MTAGAAGAAAASADASGDASANGNASANGHGGALIRRGGWRLGAVARQLRPGIPVLCTSGYSEVRAKDIEGRGQRFGFIAKPYTKTELARQLRTVFEREAMAS